MTYEQMSVNKGTLGVHQIELVVKTREDLSDGGRVGDHADGTLDLGKVSSWDDGGWLVVNTALETGWAPVDELDGTLGLDGSNGGVDVLGPLLWAVSDKVALLAAVVAWSFTAFAAIALSFSFVVPGFWAIPDLVICGSAIKTCAALTAFAKRVELFLAVVGFVVNFATASSTGP